MVFFEYMGGNPARYYYNGNFSIDPDIFFKYPVEIQKYIIGHEIAHSKGIRDEAKADEYSFNLNKCKFKYSLKYHIKALTDVLNPKDPRHAKRIQLAEIRAFKEALKINPKNEKAKEVLTKIKNKMANTSYEGQEGLSSYETEDYSNLFGIHTGLTKKSRENAAADRAAKEEKKEAKTEIKLAKANAKNAKATAIANGTFQTAGSKALDTVKGLFTKDAGVDAGGAGFVPTPETPKDNTTTYIIIGVVIVVIIGFFMYSKKKA